MVPRSLRTLRIATLLLLPAAVWAQEPRRATAVVPPPAAPAPGEEPGTPPPAPAKELPDRRPIEIHRTNYFVVNPEDGEAKFQISIKKRLSVPRRPDKRRFRNLSLYLAYTQKSFWEIGESSAPFRESNYNPELFATWGGASEDRPGWGFAPSRVGFAHESNGLSDEESRSWNQVFYVMAVRYNRIGAEGRVVRPDGRAFFTLEARFRPFHESSSNNDDIEDFYGHGEVRAILATPNFEARLSGRLGENGQGALELGVAFRYPRRVNFFWFVQGFTGYGESLIDYDVRRENARLGFLLRF